MRPIAIVLLCLISLACEKRRDVNPPRNLKPPLKPLNAVRAPVGKFFLLRQGRRHAAVKLTTEVQEGDGGYRYVWHYQADGSGSFTNANATRGGGVVFENYKRIRTEKDSVHLEDQGGSLHLECGGLRVQWSKGNWIYFDTDPVVTEIDTLGDSSIPKLRLVEIALLDETDIGDIDYRDERIVWHGKKEE